MAKRETIAVSGNDGSGKRERFIESFIEEKGNIKVLYVHTPFCIAKCRYCVYNSRVPKSNDEVNAFVDDTLPQQIYQYNRIFENVKFDEVYFGGGTPTILSPKQLDQIFDMIPDFDNIPNKCMEASPNTLTLEHIELLARNKFSFLSLGIQSLDEQLLRRYGRPTLSKEELISLCGKLQDANLYYNLDLICYLDRGDIRDLPQFEKELKYVLEYLKPNSVTIHQHFQSFWTIEKTKYLLEVINRILGIVGDYIWANSQMDVTQEELFMDTVNMAQYRLIRKPKSEYRHHMWDKYGFLPVDGYDILSIGYIPGCYTKSNVKKMVYVANYGTLEFSE